MRAKRLISQPCDSSWKRQSLEAETPQAWQAAGSGSHHQLHREESPGNQIQGLVLKRFFFFNEALCINTKAVGHTTFSRMTSFESTTRSNLSSCPVSLFRSLMWDLQPWCFIIWLMLTRRHSGKNYWETASGRLHSNHPALMFASVSQTCFRSQHPNKMWLLWVWQGKSRTIEQS